MKNIKHLLMIQVIAVQIFLSSVPANAQTNNKQSQSFLTQFEEIYHSLQIYINNYQKEFSKAVGKLEAELNQAIQSSVGDLGIPDPFKAGKNIEKVLQKQETQLLELDPGTQAKNAIKKWNQQYTRGQSQSVLGTEGQTVQRQESEITNDAISQSSSSANAAQLDVITQDILKKVAIQNLQTAVVTKSIHTEAQKQFRFLAAANMNLADISGRMDEQSKRQDSEANATAREILRTAAVNDAFWKNQW
ncbi:hypothetical protein [Nostoc flagelliforme]|nr:hypothetical protein [Nostoc flagelliforme]